MDAAWGPANATRGALAFVHIPPYVLPYRPCSLYVLTQQSRVRVGRHAIQALQPGLNHTRDPGLNRTPVFSWAVSRDD